MLLHVILYANILHTEPPDYLLCIVIMHITGRVISVEGIDMLIQCTCPTTGLIVIRNWRQLSIRVNKYSNIYPNWLSLSLIPAVQQKLTHKWSLQGNIAMLFCSLVCLLHRSLHPKIKLKRKKKYCLLLTVKVSATKVTHHQDTIC